MKRKFRLIGVVLLLAMVIGLPSLVDYASADSDTTHVVKLVFNENTPTRQELSDAGFYGWLANDYGSVFYECVLEAVDSEGNRDTSFSGDFGNAVFTDGVSSSIFVRNDAEMWLCDMPPEVSLAYVSCGLWYESYGYMSFYGNCPAAWAYKPNIVHDDVSGKVVAINPNQEKNGNDDWRREDYAWRLYIELELTDDAGNPLSGAYGPMVFANGKLAGGSNYSSITDDWSGKEIWGWAVSAVSKEWIGTDEDGYYEWSYPVIFLALPDNVRLSCTGIHFEDASGNPISDYFNTDIIVYPPESASYTVTYTVSDPKPASYKEGKGVPGQQAPDAGSKVYIADHPETDETTYTEYGTTKTGTWSFLGWGIPTDASGNALSVLTEEESGKKYFIMPESNVVINGSWQFDEAVLHNVTYVVEGDAPASFLPALSSYNEQKSAGETVVIYGALTTEETEKNGLRGKWYFNGWNRVVKVNDDGTDGEDIIVVLSDSGSRSFLMPAQNVRVIGSWTFIPSFTVAKLPASGPGPAEDSVDLVVYVSWSDINTGGSIPPGSVGFTISGDDGTGSISYGYSDVASDVSTGYGEQKYIIKARKNNTAGELIDYSIDNAWLAGGYEDSHFRVNNFYEDSDEPNVFYIDVNMIEPISLDEPMRLPAPSGISNLGSIGGMNAPQGGEGSGSDAAVFTITDEGGSTYTLSVDMRGTSSIDLPVGTYTMKETTAPRGYKLSAETWTIVVNADGSITVSPTANYDAATATLTVYDEPEANTHKVTYVYKGTVPTGAPEVPAEQTEVAYGTDVTIAANPTLAGYTFSGWKYGTYGAGDTFSMPDADVVIEGEWKANTHKVTYVYKGTVPTGAPEVPAEQTEVAYGTDVTIAANPTLAGYTFSGWKYGTYGAGDTFSMPDEDVVIEGEWKANTHKVTYVYKGTIPAGAPAVPAEQTEVAYGTEVTIAANPTLTGYTFSGWKYGSYGAGDTFSMPDEDVVIEGEWKANTHKVTYVYKGTVPAGAPAVPAEQTEVAYGTEVTIAANPTLTGYTFSGWKYGTYGAGDTFSMPDEDVVIEGEWKANTHKVTYVYKGTVPAGAPAVPTEQTEVAYGTDVTIAENPTLTGYTFSGWKYGSYGAGDTFSMPDEDVVIEGEWRANTHKVTYVYKGTVPAGAPEVPTEQTEVAYGTEVTIAANPTLTGYTFSGWKYGSYGAGDTFSMPDEDVVIEGEWKANTHKVTYVYKGTVPSGAPAVPAEQTEVAYGTDVTIAANPTLEGYTFSGWKYGPYGAGDTFSMPDEDVVIEGEWKANTHKVTYVYKGTIPAGAPAVPAEQTEVAYGTEVTIAENPTLTGYTFSGWKYGTYGAGDTFSMPDEDVVIEGEWKANTHKVTYVYKGTTPTGAPEVPTEQTEVAYGTDVTIAANPTLAGYTFSGWKYGSYGAGDTFSMPDEDVVIEGEWKANTHKVTYVYKGTVPAGAPEVPTEQTEVAYGTEVTIAANPTLTGYTFSGWKYGTYGAGDTFSMPDEDVVIEGEWKANTHKVTYVYKGTVPTGAPAVPAEQTEVAYGTEVTIAANPTLTGYTFSGWKYDSYGAGDTFSMPDADVVIEGGWRVNEYTVIYAPGEQGRWNAADETTSGLHYGDKTPDVKVDPTAEANHNPGYEFDGWDKDIASTVTESVTYTAKWKAIEYTVIYAPGEQGRWNAADETTSGLHYGDPMPVVKADPNTEHNPGYTFAGWEPQIDESVTRTITYVAQWLRIEEKKYTVSYEYIGTVPVGAPVPPTAQTYAPGAEVKVADAPTLNGYKFSGWDHSDFTMPEDNVVIRGSWTAVPKAEVIETVYYILHYESNGGTEYADERYSANTKVELTKMPTREGYIFTGWHADAALREMIDHVVMDGSKTVYAGWERVSTPAVNKVDHIAYIIGYPNGMVYPEANITRAEVATIFFRLLRDDVRAANVTSNNNYPDVSMGSWYNVAVSTMSRIGVIKGYPDGTFRPGANITRAEFAAIAARFDEKEVGVMADFSDILGHWAAMEISKAASNGWVNGYPDGTFRPDREITRAESMALINRVLERDPESEEDLLEGMITWHDNADKSKWYYVDVQEATNSHDYEHKTNGHERWLQINSIPDWTAYQR